MATSLLMIMGMLVSRTWACPLYLKLLKMPTARFTGVAHSAFLRQSFTARRWSSAPHARPLRRTFMHSHAFLLRYAHLRHQPIIACELIFGSAIRRKRAIPRPPPFDSIPDLSRRCRRSTTFPSYKPFHVRQSMGPYHVCLGQEPQ